MSRRLKARRFQALALAAMMALTSTPVFGQIARAETPNRTPTATTANVEAGQRSAAEGKHITIAPSAETANVWAGRTARPEAEQHGGGSADQPAAPASAPADQAAPAPASASASKPAEAPRIVSDDDAHISDKLRQQTQDKNAIADRLSAGSTVGGARPGDSVDDNQPSVGGLNGRDALQQTPDALSAYAYVRPYAEPNSFAYRNFCGAGASIILLSHWDANFPQNVDVDQLGHELNLDPDQGMWVRDIVGPVNRHINGIAGTNVNWYRLGNASTKDEFRWMLNVDIGQHGVPLITSLQTGDLPGWGGADVGHIVAVYGYHRDADGTEWVAYADTGSPASGYSGSNFNVMKLDNFWQAVSQNSAQVW